VQSSAAVKRGRAVFPFTFDGAVDVACALVVQSLGVAGPDGLLTASVAFWQGLCPPSFGWDNATSRCVACSVGSYSIEPNAVPCRPCVSGAVCGGGPPAAAPGYWLLPVSDEAAADVSAVVVQSFPCPALNCDGQIQSAPNSTTSDGPILLNRCGPNRDPDSALCGRCLAGYSEWSGQCVACPSVSWGSVVGSLSASWAWVAAQHFLVQNSFGTFATFFFFIQTAAFVSFPQPFASATVLLALTRNWLALGTDCLFPTDGLGTVIFSAAQSLMTLPLLILTLAVHRALRACGLCGRRPAPAREAAGEAEGWRAAVQRRLWLYGSRAAYKRSALALTVTTYQPLIEAIAGFLACERIDDGRRFGAVSTRAPALRCGTEQWTAALSLFAPLSLWAVAWPFVLRFWIVTAQRPQHTLHTLHTLHTQHKRATAVGASAAVSAVRVPYGATADQKHSGPSTASAAGLDTLLATAHGADEPAAAPAAVPFVSLTTAQTAAALLSGPFREGYSAWVVFDLARRLLLVVCFAALSAAGTDLYGQRLAYFSLITAYGLAHGLCAPYRDRTANALEAAALAALTVIAGALASQPAANEQIGDSADGADGADSLTTPLALFLLAFTLTVGLALFAVLLAPPARRCLAACRSSLSGREGGGGAPPTSATPLIVRNGPNLSAGPASGSAAVAAAHNCHSLNTI
jgi:hypothetical protein